MTFDSFAGLRDLFRATAHATDADVVVFASNGGNSSSGGDAHDIVAAVDGHCVGAGAVIAMATDLRLANPAAKCGFLFTRVALAGRDRGP